MLRLFADLPTTADISRLSLRHQLYLMISLGCLGAIVSISLLTFLYDRHRVDEKAIRHTDTLLRTIRNHWDHRDDQPSNSELLATLVESNPGLALTVVSQDGKTLAKVGNDADQSFESSLSFIPHGHSTPVTAFAWFDRSADIHASGRRTLVLALSATFVCIAVALFVGATLLAFVLRPVEQLAIGLRHGGELVAEVPPELRVLQREFNRRRTSWLATLRELEATNREVSALHTGLSENAVLAILSPLGQIQDVNRRFCEVQGQPKEQILGRELDDLGWIGDSGCSLVNLPLQWMANSLVRQELIRGSEFNPTVCIDTTFVPCRDDEGRIMKVLMIGVDVTARINAEHDVAWSRAFLHEVVASLDSHLAVLDSQGRVVMSNNAWTSSKDPLRGNKDPIDIGGNYLKALEDAAYDDLNLDFRFELVAAIHAALDRSVSRFQTECVLEDSASQRHVLVTIQSLDVHGETFVRIQRQDVTPWRKETLAPHSTQESRG